MSKVNPSYPQSILSWTDRIDESDIVWANDPNSLAAEVGAIESTLGVVPNYASAPPAGNPIQFTNVGQRLDYMTAGQQVPVCQLQSPLQQIASGQQASTLYGVYNNYTQAVYDPYGFYNGSDITVPVTGWYSIHAGQFWQWDNVGYVASHLWVGAAHKHQNLWDWTFSGNGVGGPWLVGGNIDREGFTGNHWSGIINAGQRVRVVSENGTDTASVVTNNLELSMTWHRTTPDDYNTLPPTFTYPASPLPPAAVTRYPGVTGLAVSSPSSGTLNISWSRVTKPTPLPVSYTVAIYSTQGGQPVGNPPYWPSGQSYGQLVSFTTVTAPQTSGTQSTTVSGLPTASSYQVRVWANGGLIAPPVALKNITI